MSRFSPKDTDLRARQQREHLVALYVAACDYARQLEGAVVEGRSPTGYGPPLTPLPAEQAEAIMAPVRAYLQALRSFVALYAGEELAQHEKPQPRSSTWVWASNLLERLRQIADDFAPRRLRRYGIAGEEATRPFEELREKLLAAIAGARQALPGAARAAREAKASPHQDGWA